MKRTEGIFEGIVNMFGRFCGWLVLLMVLLVFTEVFFRYVIGKPLMVADEFSAYMLVFMSYLGMAYAWKERAHIRITIMVDRLPLRVASWLRLASLVTALAFTIILNKAAYGFVLLSFKLNRVSPTHLHTPLQVPHLAILVGFSVLSLLLILEIARAISSIRAGRPADVSS